MSNMDKLGVFQDPDGSIKSVFQTDEGGLTTGIIEMTLLVNREGQDRVCVPTHNYCNLGCKMCHLCSNTAKKKPMIPVREDDFIEALGQSVTDPAGERRTDNDKLLVSYMGVGEPTLNQRLIEGVHGQSAEMIKTLGYSSISYAISTMMPNATGVPRLIDVVDDLSMPMKLHFSLHNPIDSKRRELIPRAAVSVEEALDLLQQYSARVRANQKAMATYALFHTGENPALAEIHYTLIDGVNDGDDELSEMERLLRQYDGGIPIKFIKFNPKPGMLVSQREDEWADRLRRIEGQIVKTYTPPGREIGASCGESTKHYYLAEQETDEDVADFLAWRRKYEIETGESLP